MAGPQRPLSTSLRVLWRLSTPTNCGHLQQRLTLPVPAPVASTAMAFSQSPTVMGEPEDKRRHGQPDCSERRILLPHGLTPTYMTQFTTLNAIQAPT